MEKHSSEMQDALRKAGLAVLRKRFQNISPVTSQGVQEGTRLSFTKGGDTFICAVKVTTRGRIHFARQGAGWATLSHVDRVLYVRLRPGDPPHFEAQMHACETLVAAFEANRQHAETLGLPHRPAWLNADPEAGDRFVGSGFGKQALWVEVGPLLVQGATSAPSDDVRASSPAAPRKLTIAEAKEGLAATLGISPDAIEIIIRA
jgi:hypothetical protein